MPSTLFIVAMSTSKNSEQGAKSIRHRNVAKQERSPFAHLAYFITLSHGLENVLKMYETDDMVLCYWQTFIYYKQVVYSFEIGRYII